MNPFEMVVLIVAITGVVSVLRARLGVGRAGEDVRLNDPDTAALRDEIRALRDRVAVLECIVTDGDRSGSLAREIDALRSRD